MEYLILMLTGALVQEHTNSPSSEPDWHLSRYPLDKLYLLELRHVSEGSWQPVLSYIA